MQLITGRATAREVAAMRKADEREARKINSATAHSASSRGSALHKKQIVDFLQDKEGTDNEIYYHVASLHTERTLRNSIVPCRIAMTDGVCPAVIADTGRVKADKDSGLDCTIWRLTTQEERDQELAAVVDTPRMQVVRNTIQRREAALVALKQKLVDMAQRRGEAMKRRA